MQYQLIPENLNPRAKKCNLSIVCDTKLDEILWCAKEDYPNKLKSIAIGEKLKISKNGTYCIEFIATNDVIKTEFTVFHLNTSEGFAGGDGSLSSPYLIRKCSDFNSIRLNLNAHYRLVSDLHFENEMGDLCWIPIGHYSFKEPKLASHELGFNINYGFLGSIDGGGHTISGLKCEHPKLKNIGIFGSCGPNSYIHDIIIEECSFSGNQALNIGSISGYAYGTKIEHCIVRNGCIAAPLIGGGIVGECSGNSKIRYCQFTGTITGEGTEGVDSRLGGMIGIAHTFKTDLSYIDNCCVKASITNCAYGGGILSGSGAILSKCFFCGTIRAKRYAAGIVAPGNLCVVEKCICGPSGIYYESNDPLSYIDSAWVTLCDESGHETTTEFLENIWLNHAGRIVCNDYKLLPQAKYRNYATQDCRLASLEKNYTPIEASLRDGFTILTQALCSASFYEEINWEFISPWEIGEDHFPQIS